MALDELLDRDRVGALATEPAEGSIELGLVVDPGRVEGASPGAWLEDQRIAHGVGELEHLVGVVGRPGRGRRHARRP